MMNENKQKINDRIARGLFRRSCLVLVVIIAAFTFLSIGNVFGARLQVRTVEKDGTLGVLSAYRWLVEEDVTYRVIPGVQNPNTQAVSFHKSYMPVVAEGDDTTPLPTLDPDKFYFVSVTPKTTGAYSMGGGQLVGNGRLVVCVNALPLPTAQISVFIHEDMGPINNAWDQGERGLEGFRIVLEDAGGRYGMSAGTQMADAYGNVLGTVYVQTCDQYGQNPGTGSSGCLDPEGSPTIATDLGGDPVVDSMVTGPDGKLSIRNLAPGKYGIIAIPPNAVEDPPESGNYVSSSWIQTTTIEGTRVIDAWVKANEPPFFAEFGHRLPTSPSVLFRLVPTIHMLTPLS